MKLKYTDEELHAFRHNILQELPSLDFDKINVGCGYHDEPGLINIYIIPENLQQVHIRVAFLSVHELGHQMETREPIMNEYTVIASHLVMFGVTNISQLKWHTEKWDSTKDYMKSHKRRF